jgi:hypothetical protein
VNRIVDGKVCTNSKRRIRPRYISSTVDGKGKPISTIDPSCLIHNCHPIPPKNYRSITLPMASAASTSSIMLINEKCGADEKSTIFNEKDNNRYMKRKEVNDEKEINIENRNEKINIKEKVNLKKNNNLNEKSEIEKNNDCGRNLGAENKPVILKVEPVKDYEFKVTVAEFFCSHDIGLAVVESVEFNNLVELLWKKGQEFPADCNSKIVPKLNRFSLKEFIEEEGERRIKKDLLFLKGKYVSIIIDGFSARFGHFVIVLLVQSQYSCPNVTLLGLYGDVWKTDDYARMMINVLLICWRLDIGPAFLVVDGAYAQVDGCNANNQRSFRTFLPKNISSVPGLVSCANHRLDAVFNHSRRSCAEFDEKCKFVHKWIVYLRKTDYGKGCPEPTEARWIYLMLPMKWVERNKKLIINKENENGEDFVDVVNHFLLILEPLYEFSLLSESSKTQLVYAFPLVQQCMNYIQVVSELKEFESMCWSRCSKAIASRFSDLFLMSFNCSIYAVGYISTVCGRYALNAGNLCLGYWDFPSDIRDMHPLLICPNIIKVCPSSHPRYISPKSET